MAVALLVLPAVTAQGVRAADTIPGPQHGLQSDWNQDESGLSPQAVSGGDFGQLFSTAVSGQVYAQPLVVGSTVIVATENDWVYGLDSDTGEVDWSVSLGTPWPTSSLCGDLTPDVGVTSTPVLDPVTRTVYLIAATMAGSVVQYHLFGISPYSGTITERVTVSGMATNTAGIGFTAADQWQRTGLLMMNGWVYAGFGSHCDDTPYEGFIAGVNVATRATTLWTDLGQANDTGGGIWQGGGALMSDGPGRIFFTSGNGAVPPPGPGTSPPGDLADSAVRLEVQPNGTLAAQDFFSAADAATLSAEDIDFGSGGPVGLPFGTRQYPHLMVAAGKDGTMYVLNRDDLGGREQGPGGTDAALGVIHLAGQWGHPAAFAGQDAFSPYDGGRSRDFLYYVGSGDYLREMEWTAAANGIPVPKTVATSSVQFGYTSGSPMVTSLGSDPGSAVVWEVAANDSSGAGGALYAYPAVPPGHCTAAAPCTIAPLWSAPIGTASKFSVPAAADGRVYVGTRDGHVLGFGSTSWLDHLLWR